MDWPAGSAPRGSNSTSVESVGLRLLSTAGPALPRVVSLVTSLMSASTQAAAPTSGNLTVLKEQRGGSSGSSSSSSSSSGSSGFPPTDPALGFSETPAGLQGVLVAVQALVLFSIFLLSSLGNAAVMVVILKHRRLWTVTNAFIMSLSLSDFLTAALCLPFSFTVLFSRDGAWAFGEAFCVANGFLNTCFGIVSTLTMTLISFDRYYAIVRQPQAKIDRGRAAQLLAAVWLTAVVFSLPWQLLVQRPKGVHHRSGFYHCMYAFHPGGWGLGAAYSVCLVLLCYLLPFSLMCFCHYNISKTVRLSEVRVRPVTTYAHLLRFYSEMRTATTVLIMIVFIIFCWGPYCLMGLVAALGGHAFGPAVDAVAICLAWANGAVNPLIYALRNPNISMLLGRSREEGYRTAYLCRQSQRRAVRVGQAQGAVRDRCSGRANTCGHLPRSSPAKGEAGVWAYKNPAVFFFRDAQQDTTAPPETDEAPKTKTSETSL